MRKDPDWIARKPISWLYRMSEAFKRKAERERAALEEAQKESQRQAKLNRR